ncbi:MAG: autotransporter domain-containing protein [Actinomycetospora chiangmaiensis]|nr:autotransporter domain-containing protein [Actinomycetospora chiangmaiensis]
MAGGSALALCGLGSTVGQATTRQSGSVDRDADDNLSIGYQANGGMVVGGGDSVQAAGLTLGVPAGVRGIVQILGSSTLQASGAVTIGAAGTGQLSLSGGSVLQVGSQGGGAVTIARDAGSSGTLYIGSAPRGAPLTAGSLQAGSVAFGSGTGTIVFNHAGNPDGSPVTFAPTISGTGSVSQIAGTTILPGANTYAGQTTISGGTLTIQNSTALGVADGTAANGTIVAGGTLALQGGVAVGNEALSLTGSGIGGGGALRSVSGANSYAGPVALDGGAYIGVDAGSTLLLSGAITGTSYSTGLFLVGAGDGTITSNVSGLSALVKYGTGSWTLTGPVVANVTAVGNGTLAVSQGGALTSSLTYIGFGPQVDGPAALTVSGAGSSFTNASTLNIGMVQSGSLTISDGASAVSGGQTMISAAWGVSGAATVTGRGSTWATTGTLTVGGYGPGTLTVADGGTVSVGAAGAGTLNLASGSNSSGTLIVGAAAGQAPVAPGTVQAAEVTTGIGTGTIVFNHTSTGYTFDPAISGSASVMQLGGTTILTNTSTFTGPTTVSGGTLQVDGTLTATDVTVASGGTLAGSGKIGDPLIQAGGTLAPGSASTPGTLSIYGPLTFEPGSFYRVRLSTTANDRTDVTGPVTIQGGTVQVLAGAGTLLPGKQYTILTATGGITGSFTSLQTTTDLAFLSSTLSYGPTSLTLGVTQSAPFTSVATTPNQAAAAQALAGVPFTDGTTPASPASQVATALVNQTAPGARQALTALSGEGLSSAVATRIQGAFTEQAAILDHLRFGVGTGPAGGDGLTGTVGQRFAAGTTLPASYSAFTPKQDANLGRVTVQPEATRTALWGTAFGSFGSSDSTRNTARLTRETGGFVLGAETGPGALDDWRLGVAAGYSFTQFDITARQSSGQIESGFGSVYARGPLGPLQVRLGTIYAGDAYDTRRSVLFPGVSQVANGHNGGDTLQGFGEVGYRIGGAQGFIEPFVGGAALRIHRDGFTETGGSAALTVFGRTTAIETVTAGVQGQTVLADLWGGAGPLLARGLVGVRWAFGDVTPVSLLAFRGGGSLFQTAGAPVADEAALISAGLDWQVAPGTHVGLSYEGQLGRRAQDNAVKGNVSYRW